MGINPHPENRRVRHPAPVVMPNSDDEVTFAESLRPEGVSYRGCDTIGIRA